MLVATFYPIFAIFVSYVLTTTYTQILETVEKTRLFKQATRDGLTNLWNIRHFNMLFDAEFKNIARFRYRKLSIILSDIDDFKHVNDTYGHQAGDIVLKEVANVMRTVSRKLDVVARYGGEEFIIMLIGTGEDGAKELGEKIRAAFEAKQFKFGDKTYKTTISLGVAEFKTEKTKEELIEKADQALYTSKREGKNRVTIWKNPSEKK